MRSFFLFLCCFLFLAIAIYFSVQAIWRPEAIASAALPVRAESFVSLPVLRQATQKGDIIRSSDFYWVRQPAHLVIEDDVTRKLLDEKPETYFSVLRSVGAGEIITQEELVQASDPEFLVKILKPGFRIIEVTFNADTLSFQRLQVGNYLDLSVMLTPDKRGASSRTTGRTVLVARSVRVIEKDQNGAVLLEARDRQGPVIMTAVQAGRLSFMVRPKADRTSIRDDSEDIIQKLASFYPKVVTPAGSEIIQKIVIHRGAKKTSVSLPFAQSGPK